MRKIYKITILAMLLFLVIGINSFAVTGNDIANQAVKYVGKVTYRYGAEGENYMDCSAFVRRVFSDFGISIPRCSDSQYYAGTQILEYHSGADVGLLVPGDILVKRGVGKSGHVGIYIGNNEFVDCSSSKRGVARRSLAGNTTFNAATRIVGGGFENSPVSNSEVAQVSDVWLDYDIYIDGKIYYSSSYIDVEVDEIPQEILLIDATKYPNSENATRKWIYYNPLTYSTDIVKGGDQQVIALWNKLDSDNIITVSLNVDGCIPKQETVIHFSVKKKVWSDFKMVINGVECYSQTKFEHFVDEIPSEINVFDITNRESNYVNRKWEIYNSVTDSFEYVGSASEITVNLEGKLDQYNGTTIRMSVEGEEPKTSIISFVKNEKQEPIEDFGVNVTLVDYNGLEIVKEYTGNETIIISDSKQVNKELQFINKSNFDRYEIEWKIWNENKQQVEYVDGKQIEAYELVKRCGTLQEDGRYKIGMRMTLSDGSSVRKDLYFRIAEYKIELENNLIGKGETKENPILVGEIPIYIKLLNVSGINVVKYEIWNQHTETFETIGNTQNEQWISIPTGGYGLFALDKDYSNNGIASIAIRMVLEDGTISSREIFFKKLILNSPLQGQVIDENKDLVISWNDMGKGVEYRVRMVNLTDKTLNGENTVIYEGEVVSGTSFKVPSNKLQKDKDYRIAVKPEEGTYWNIRTITTHEMETPEIVNMKEGQEIVAERELSVQMKKELLESEKYYLTITNPSGKEVLKQSVSKNIVISAEELKEKGTYKIEVIKVRTVDQAGTIVSGKQTISFKVI